MVVERVFQRLVTRAVYEFALALALVGFAIITSSFTVGCVKSQSVTRTRASGSCAGACSHYISCSGKDSKEVYAACFRECRFAYSDRGNEDKRTLGHIESFDCAEIVSFVEGSSGRAPGAPVPKSRAPSPQNQAD